MNRIPLKFKQFLRLKNIILGLFFLSSILSAEETLIMSPHQLEIMNVSTRPRLIRSFIIQGKSSDYPSYSILFTYQHFQPTKKSIYINSSLTGWRPKKMHANSNNIHYYILPLQINAENFEKKYESFEYKYLVENIWITDPQNPNQANDRYGQSLSVHYIDFGQIDNKVMRLRKSSSDDQRIFFQIYAPEAKSVALVGDFNGWANNSRYALRRIDSTGYFSLDLTFPPGRHSYLFLIDNEYYKKDTYNPNSQYRAQLDMICSFFTIF